MSTISSIATRVCDRLEESETAPVFWSLQSEIYSAIAEAMNEAALITGTVEVAQPTPLTLPTNTTYIPMPANAIALLRVQAPNMIQKTSLFTLDKMIPGWQNETGTAIRYWFPVGLNKFGIYPQLSVQQEILVTYLGYPVTNGRPLTGAETVPFGQEYQDALEQYAAHILRLKEGGAEFELSQVIYSQFLSTMKSLTAFQARHDSLVFTRSLGAGVRPVPTEVR